MNICIFEALKYTSKKRRWRQLLMRIASAVQNKTITGFFYHAMQILEEPKAKGSLPKITDKIM